MFITFYDKNFKAIANNSSVTIDKFRLSRRSYDLDTFNCECQPISLDADPMFAIVKEDEGNQFYSCLAPIFSLKKDGKGSVVARDLKSIFDTQVIMDFTQTQLDVKKLIKFIFDEWNKTASGFNVQITIDEIPGEVYQPHEKKEYNVLALYKKIFSFYNLYISSKINVKTKTLIFEVKRIYSSRRIQIKLEDFGIQNFGKTMPQFNRAVAANKDYTQTSEWYLLQSGEITSTSSKQNIFPTLTRVYKAETLRDAEVEAILALAENRNQEAIKIELTPADYIYNEIGFNSSVDVYYGGKLYKTLPVGAIDQTEGIKKTITLGYKPVDLIQII